MFKIKKETFINEKRPHESGMKHVSGRAYYTDDIPESPGTLYGAIGWSKKAHAIIKKINLDEVIKSEGVIAVVTKDDIVGRNDVGPVYDGDPIFPQKAEYYGQPLFAVAAKTTELARKAVLKAKISYKTLKPIITIQNALKKKSFVLKEKIIKKGEALKAIENSVNRLKGNFTTGSQEHFALEGQTAFVIPEEDNDFKVFSSTQHPSETQQIIAKMLNQKSNTITVETRRIGGGFGGKETQSFIFAAICTLLAKKTKHPVKIRMDRDDDIIITGKRHDFYSEYEVGFDELGVIKGLKLKLASRCGLSPDLSGAINERALLHIDNAYYLENILVENYLCKTNTASNTAFRGFGGNQGMMAIENIIDNIATSLKKDSAEIRRRNFYQKKKKNITHYNMKIEDNVIQEIFDQLIKSSNYKSRQLSIKKFNKGNKYIKKGIALTPVKFGISFTTWHLNQAGALVHIYCNDGSVHINTGAIEMGQGTYTKIAQLAANAFGLPFNKIKVSATRTDKVPNTSASAASSTTDLNGAAALNAISKIKQNLALFVKRKYKIKNGEAVYENGMIKFKGKSFKFNTLIKEAYLNRVSTEWLNNNLSKVSLFDASWHMPNSNRNGHKEYLNKHIPEAMFWNLDEHSDKDSSFPHMLPNSDYWTRMLWSFGIKNDDHIVVYDFSDVHSACRLCFSLKYFGHQKVSVLDGGMKKWLKENRPTSNKINKDIGKFNYIDKINTKNKYKVSENFDWVKKKKQIDDNIKNNLFTLVDGRSRERFEGKVEEPRPNLKKGCIPGSKNIPFQDCINLGTNTFKRKSELIKIFKESDVDCLKPNVFMCGSGVTACVLGLAYFLITDKNAVIYDGSFAEWGKK